ncbi:2,3-bisphosphoglycerate-independent phosphoglycerate mutase [Methanohalophilus levihalophilus]|uniref:2,3-bisphosphoglycerate-independent phosphoglycerate mutase n=1 Tax=Methanohalophilus levihalophilus TaxID=1431282 RepID=UPI001AE42B4F|nr:2,3-bisphosphoglycerate-independent phosphoglycerate mutase [Methanohalophilus levihalophilus]MBP2030651.1 2,3-bisphosphoglycerate-independent phosphoglycerate mutase [Methanohalophilus levihalophilus]
MENTGKPLLLMILDGWGYSPEKEGNAIASANTPNLDRLIAEYPNSLLKAAGEAVGLPEGQMGNSEVGHLNIGAGRIVYQDFTRINLAIRNEDFFSNKELLKAIRNVKDNKSSLHLMGLFSYGGVHSHMNHLRALIEMANREGLEEVFVHTFLDGRDVPPRAALEDMKEHEEYYANSIAKIASVAGRYYAMDRDRRWDRTQLAYDALTKGEGLTANSSVEAVQNAYDRGENDEFVKPTVVVDDNGEPVATIKDGDSVIFFNFRPDRARQLTYAFVEDDFEGFERDFRPDVHYVCMTQYDEKLDVPLAYPPENIKNTLGEVLSREGKKQLRIAETEKYAHVTFFFNGGVEHKFEGEERCLVPSPKVATYDLKPEMSAYEVTEELVQHIRSEKYDVIILNYANMDMVGHTGFFDAAVKAVEDVDDCIGKVIETLQSVGGEALIIADHGNAEKMEDPNTNQPHTAHSNNPVRCLCISKRISKIHDGILADVSPTILEMIGLKKPPEMTGNSLIEIQNH